MRNKENLEQNLTKEKQSFDEYISETKVVLDKHRDYEVINGIKWYFIELPKFRRMNPDLNEKIVSAR